MKPLTQRQRDIYNKIEGFVIGRGYFPTMREIAFMLGTKNISTAQYFMEELRKKGWIKSERNKRSASYIATHSENKGEKE